MYPNEIELQWSVLIVLYPFLTGLVAGAFILASLERVFRVFLEDLAGGGDGHFAAAAVEQLGANFFFQRPDLRRDCRLRAETPLCRPRKAAELGYFEKRFQLIEVHGSD